MKSMLTELKATLERADKNTLPDVIVNAPFKHKLEMVSMGIGIIVFLVKNESDGQIHRIALCNTEMGEATRKISLVKFEEILIPADHDKNILAKAIRLQEPQMTSDWEYLFTPALEREQAHLNQSAGGIATSCVYPLKFNNHEGALIFSYYKEAHKITNIEKSFMDDYSQLICAVLDEKQLSAKDLLPA